MKKYSSFEEQKGTRYTRENVYFCIIILSCLLSTKMCLRFLLNCFVREIKDKFLLSEFLRKWGWFQEHNERFSKTLKNQKAATRFCRWKSTDNNKINISLPLENPCTCLLAKEKTWKRIFNTNSKLWQNRS